MNEENIQNHKFKRGVSGNPNGRPKRIISQFAASGYKKSEINDTITQLLALTINELEQISTNETATVLEASVSKALLTSYRKGSLDVIETIISRRYGKAKEVTEITVAAELIAARNMFFKLIHQEKLPQDDALRIVLTSAKNHGFQLDVDKILNVDTFDE
jgi:hypothetical protein